MSGETDQQFAPRADPLGAMQDLEQLEQDALGADRGLCRAGNCSYLHCS